MINIKNNIEYLCKYHNCTFKLVKGKYSLYYRCPKYEFQYRKPGEKVCTNSVSLKVLDQIGDEIEKLYNDGLLRVGYCGKYRNIKYKVQVVSRNYIEVLIINMDKKREDF